MGRSAVDATNARLIRIARADGRRRRRVAASRVCFPDFLLAVDLLVEALCPFDGVVLLALEFVLLPDLEGLEGDELFPFAVESEVCAARNIAPNNAASTTPSIGAARRGTENGKQGDFIHSQ